MPGVTQKIELNDGPTIRRLSANKIAQLASLDANLAGYPLWHWHRFTQWTSIFFEKRIELEKTVVTETKFDQISLNNIYDWESNINEEVSLLRCLLNETPSVTTFSFIRDAFPRDPGGGGNIRLPWRARLPNWIEPPGKNEAKAYVKRRAKFLSSYGKPGWDSVTISPMFQPKY